MNPPALSKPAASKPSRLICVASRRETWPVKILIITTSWKPYARFWFFGGFFIYQGLLTAVSDF